MKLPRGQIVNAVLVIAAIGSVIAVFATSGAVTTSEIERRSDSLLVAYREDEISYVKIERGDKSLVLERGAIDDGGLADWHLREPVDEEADISSVQEFLDTLEFASWTRRVNPEEVDRARFGLDQPRWVMRIRMGKIGYRLRLGKPAASPEGSAYLEVDGDGAPKPGVGIISKTLLAELEVTADSFRERLVMPYVSSALERMVLEGLGGTRKLRSAAWDGWRFDGMEGNRRVNRIALDRVLLQFARTQADRFLDVKTCEKALEGAETVRVTMFPKGDRPKGVVVVGGRCPTSEDDVVALRREPDPVGACVPQSVMEGLSTSARELVDLHLFAMRKDEVESFVVTRGDDKLEVVRNEAGYRMRHPKEGDVEAEAGDKRLFDIIGARGKLVEDPDEAKLGLDGSTWKVVLSSVAEEDSKVKTETVTLGAPGADGTVHAKREHDGAVIAVSRGIARVLGPDSTLVRSREVLDFEKADLREIDMVAGAVRQRLERHASGTFTLHEPKGFDPDPGLAADLVDRLASLRADRWVADADDGTFGLDDPQATVRVTLAKGDAGQETRRIVVGELTSGGAFATLDGDRGVFVLPRAALDNVRHSLLDRGVFVVEPREVATLSIEGRGKKVLLQKDGRGFSQSGGDAELSAGRIQVIVDQLSTMRADIAVHTGPPLPLEGMAKPTLAVKVERVPGAGDRSKPIEWRVGAGDSWEGTSVFYARRRGVDATYVIARSKVLQVLNAL